MNGPLSRPLVMLAAAVVAVACAVVAAVLLAQSPSPAQSSGAAVAVLPPAGESTVEIASGDSAALIGRRLLQGGTIASHTRFELLALLLGWESRLEPGVYSFEGGLTTYEVLRRIHFGETSPLRIVIPEGLRVEQVVERLALAQVVSPTDLGLALQGHVPAGAEGTLAAYRPAGASLEGYLFPSAYSFPLGVTAAEAVGLMLARFDESISPALRAQIEASGWSLHEILTMASIIEREAMVDAERALVAAVIWNRLAAGMPLQMNSTVQYAVGAAGQPGGWWPPELSDADLALDSPFNSYRYHGLPPTPIASPGLASIEAAANPASVPYLYFVAKGDGTHAFAVTYEEHQANVERYLGGSQ